jgi:hypothetical protein
MRNRKTEIARYTIEIDMPKANGRCVLHSWEAFMFACILEGVADVKRYGRSKVSIPYEVAGKSSTYTPELFVEQNAAHLLIDVGCESSDKNSPQSERQSAIDEWCVAHNYQYQRIPGNRVWAQSCLAFNWARISRWLMQSLDESPSPIRPQICSLVASRGTLSVGQVVRHFDARPEHHTVTAICHLLHTGGLTAELSERPFSSTTALSLSS